MFLLKTLGLFLLQTFMVAYAQSQPTDVKTGSTAVPNIIFIMADDLGWQDVGFMGSEWFETPNLDNLASESLVFNQAYMYPTCSPSRAAFMTGQHSFRTGVYMVPVLERGAAADNIFSRWTVSQHNPMFSEILSKNGYKMSHIGKWHLVGPYPAQEHTYPFQKPLKQPQNGDFSWLKEHLTPEVQQYYPTGRGYDENVAGTFWGDPARGYVEGYRSQSGGYHAPFKNPFIQAKPTDEWLTDRMTDEAIDFISRHQQAPFFVNLNFYSPHRPTVSRSEQTLKHFLNKLGDQKTGQGVTQNDKIKTQIAAYATMISNIDLNVERLLDYLDANNLRENTLIIFTSDNGFNGKQSVNNQLRGQKGSFYEGGIRVPLIANWPSKIKAGKSDIVVSGLDYFPTFMELAKIDPHELLLDGQSLVPVLNGHDLPARSLIWHLPSRYKNPPATVIRRGKWKLIQYLLEDKVELYDLQTDLAESNDLSKKELKVVQNLVNELTIWREINQVPVPANAVVHSVRHGVMHSVMHDVGNNVDNSANLLTSVDKGGFQIEK